MNSPHLTKGSQCPPLKQTVRIYNMRYCPYAQRAVMVALAKNIPHDIVNCNLKEKPEFLLAKNPAGKVPTIELQDKKILYESLIVSDYLDEKFPNRPLQAKDPFQKAWDRILVEEFNKVITLFYKIATSLKQIDADALKENLSKLQQELSPFEQELKKRGTLFFGGNTAGMLDLMIWPWIERMPVFKLSIPSDIYDFEAAKRSNPKLEAWRKAMKDEDAVKQVFISPEIHKQFMESHFSGNPNYELLKN